jgi:anti-sigma factor RsiW
MSRFANEHERTFELACLAFAESISDSDRRWLEQHLVSCSDCRARNQQTEQMVAALKTVSISADVDVVRSTQRRVRGLCQRQEARKRRMLPIWISSGFASAWMACSAPYLWQSFDLTGHWLHIPDVLWQMAFLVAWFTPALTGAAGALWLRPHLTQAAPLRAARATA